MSSQFREIAQIRMQLNALIRQASLNEQKQQRLQHLELQLIGIHAPSELLDVLLVKFPRDFELDRVHLVLHDPDDEIRHLLKPALIAAYPERLQFRHDLNELAGLFASNPEPILGSNARFRNPLLFPETRETGSGAILPLLRKQRLIGVLSMSSDRTERFIEGSATHFLQRLAAIIAICLENALNHERLKWLGLIDPLTGVHNRRYFDERLAEETARVHRQGQPLSCLFLDIDHFKRFNDRFGHHVGDQVLRDVAGTIRSQLRSSDLLARFGGEEFAVLLIDMDDENARDIAERIRLAVAGLRAVCIDDHSANVTISIGCSSLRLDTYPPAEDAQGRRLLERADRALYRAKHSGRNRVCCC